MSALNSDSLLWFLLTLPQLRQLMNLLAPKLTLVFGIVISTARFGVRPDTLCTTDCIQLYSFSHRLASHRVSSHHEGLTKGTWTFVDRDDKALLQHRGQEVSRGKRRFQ